MSAVLHRNVREPLPVAVRGAGIYLFDRAGKRYLDASGGAAVSSLGHGHPEVAAAVHRQMQALEFAHTSFFSSEPAEELATRLIALAPRGFGRGRVAFFSGGSEAVEGAIKLARQFHVEAGQRQRTHFIARRMSYHGNTLGALALSGHPGRRAVYEPMLMAAAFVSPCHPYRYQRTNESADDYADRLAGELDQEIEGLGPETVAAFIVEPVVGATLGAVTPVGRYLARVREICNRHGVLLIADEIMCGMGRCGDFFVSEQEAIVPDLITVAKGLGGGYQPIAGVLVQERVAEAIARGSGQLAHGHTYMAHPVACAAALAVIDCIRGNDLLANVKRQGQLLERRLRDTFGSQRFVGDIRGRGLLWALELVRERQTKEPFPQECQLAGHIKSRALEYGLICYPSSGTVDGRSGDHVLLAPPFTIDEAQIDELIAKLSSTLEVEVNAASRSGRWDERR
jgi:adenosylmethionine-8-amino-7-oxononanoate aminotransferase